MSKKHLALAVLAGWAIAWVLPPQRVLAIFKGKAQ